jgi:hypothetical protein
MMIETIPAQDRLSFIFPQRPNRNKKHEKTSSNQLLAFWPSG